MKKKRVMILGPSGSGKTSIANILNDDQGVTKKNQDAVYKNNTIDVPSAYLENPSMYKHIIALSQDASHILILVDQTRPIDIYSPGFSKVFKCPIIGIISKSKQKTENNQLCKRQLANAGIKPSFLEIDIEDGTGIEELKLKLNLDAENKCKGE